MRHSQNIKHQSALFRQDFPECYAFTAVLNIGVEMAIAHDKISMKLYPKFSIKYADEPVLHNVIFHPCLRAASEFVL